MIPLEQAQTAKAEVVRLLERAGKVAAVGITRDGDDYAVKVNLTEPLDSLDIPASINGVLIRVETTGVIRPR